MYNFIETTEQSTRDISSLAITYNGINIDETIEGFSVLNVFGRETNNVELESLGVDIGSIPIHQRIEAQPITVEYQLKAKDDISFKKSYRDLMKILYQTENVPFSFADEEVTYFGRYTTHDGVDNLSNDVVTRFELYRSKPFKYGKENNTNGTLPNGEQLELLRLEVKPTTTTSNLTITNGTHEIRFVDSVTTGDVVVFDFLTTDPSERITKNGNNFAYGVAIDSDVENFNLNAGGNVTSAEANLTMFSRERWL